MPSHQQPPLPSLPRAFFGYSQSNVITFGINNNNNNFEELAVKKGRHSIIKDAKKYAEELDLRLWLNFPNSVAVADGKEVEAKKVKKAIYKARQQEIQLTVSEERWQG